MIKNFNDWKLNEAEKKEPSSAKAYPTMVFTDVVGSSKLWAKDAAAMEKNLDKHFKIITKIAKKWKGMVVKTIGDAFMIHFSPSDNSLLDGINCVLEIMESDTLGIRAGICYGDMKEKEYTLQGARLKDYFGNAINTASRLESTVSDKPGCASFSYIEDITEKQSEAVLKRIEDFKFEKIEYTDDCSKDKDILGKRSARLLTDVDIKECKDIQDLKGIKDIIAYKVYT